jgi:hypothetical protein
MAASMGKRLLRAFAITAAAALAVLLLVDPLGLQPMSSEHPKRDTL